MASSAASSDSSVSQIMTPVFSLEERSFTSTGSPPTSFTISLSRDGFEAITVRGTLTPLAERSWRTRILLRLAAMASAPFRTGTPDERELVHHREAVLVDGEADAGDDGVGAREGLAPVVERRPRSAEPHLDLQGVDHPRPVPPLPRRLDEAARRVDGRRAREDGEVHGPGGW